MTDFLLQYFPLTFFQFFNKLKMVSHQLFRFFGFFVFLKWRINLVQKLILLSAAVRYLEGKLSEKVWTFINSISFSKNFCLKGNHLFIRTETCIAFLVINTTGYVYFNIYTCKYIYIYIYSYIEVCTIICICKYIYVCTHIHIVSHHLHFFQCLLF